MPNRDQLFEVRRRNDADYCTACRVHYLAPGHAPGSAICLRQLRAYIERLENEKSRATFDAKWASEGLAKIAGVLEEYHND